MIVTILCFLLILTVIVSIHEFGHFLFAKKAGIYVYEFSIGMGPRLCKFKRKNDETEYSIRLLPIGGFVQMAGETDEVDEKVPKEKNMQNKTWIQRFLVVIAGIMFNFFLAIVLLFVVGLATNSPQSTTITKEVEKDSPAYKAGLVDGDRIVAINNKKINSADRLQLELAVLNGKTAEFKVIDQNNNEKIITITPEKITEGKTTSYKYGFGLKTKTHKGIWEAIKYAFMKFGSLIVQMFLTIWYLITGKVGLSNLSGPVGIYSVVEQSAKLGFINVIYLTGYLSLNIGVMNLLPIPALDGGRLLFLIIEKIKGTPLNPKYENLINNIGFLLLMLLIVFVSYNDILRLFK